MVEYRSSEDTHQAIATPAPRLLSPPHPLTPVWGTGQNSHATPPALVPVLLRPLLSPFGRLHWQIAPLHSDSVAPTSATHLHSAALRTQQPSSVLRTFRPYPTASVPPAVGGCYTTHCRGQYSARPPSCRASVLSSRLLRWLRFASRLRRLGVLLARHPVRAGAVSLFGGFVPHGAVFRKASTQRNSQQPSCVLRTFTECERETSLLCGFPLALSLPHAGGKGWGEKRQGFCREFIVFAP